MRQVGRSAAVFVCTLLMAAGFLVALPAPLASSLPALPAGFVLRDQASGQAAYDLTDFAYLPDGSMLTTGKSGRLAWVAADGRTRTIATLPVRTDGDLGLLSVEPAHDYATSRQIYLARSVPSGGAPFTLRLARWTVTGATEPTGIAQEQVLLEFAGDVPTHALTGIVADDDGTLWVTNGDNASPAFADRLALRSLDINAIQGKLLHITSTGLGVPGNPYYDPANPASVRSKVYASGLRSPFRLTLDPGSGLPIVGEVGWNDWEEVDIVLPGRSYAWPCWEANIPTPGYSTMPECAGVPNTPPLWAYQHGSASNQGNSVTGGIVYSGTSYPAQYRGAYFFGDYVGKKIWTLRYDAQGKLTQAPQNPPLGIDIGGPVKFAAAPNGDIVYADIYSATLRRLTYTQGNTAPVAKAATSTNPATRTVTFDASESVDFDGDQLTYQWSFGDGTSGTGVRATHTYAAGADQFTAVLTVTDPLGATGSTQITVAPSNNSPALQLTTPGNVTFAVGESIGLGATATDAEDGVLPVSWTSRTVHCPDDATCHAHPGVSASTETFSAGFTDHTDSRMEFTATATDSAGVATSATYVARPREHRLTLVSNIPATLQIPAEGGVSSSMVTEGATLDVVAAPVAADGASPFAGWADGPAATTRTLTMGAADTTLTANYTTPIEQRYNAEPALRQLLGAPTGPETADIGARYRAYERGRLYWSPQTGVREVHGAILDKYLQLGGPGRWGVPVTDQTATADGAGQFNHFTQRASIYWTAATGARGICCQIRETWAALGWERSYLGYPATDETATADGIGRFNHFTNRGSIFWSPATGAQAVCCQIRELWSALGWERSYLGYPVTGELVAPDGVGHFNHFANRGSIYWTPWAGAVATCCQIREKWASMGWERSYLGYPVTSERVTPDGIGHYNHFTNRGSIYWTPFAGAVATCCQIRERWAALGWERSYLGYPVSDEFAIPGGKRTNYQYGYITWTAATGRVTDRRY
ncbi:PQQ-dependent sugar dehydrogenase [Amycolatopsis anabasis]|uniref:PQQ-dependent sugar dehydrogenase n=1 Tax=Amycolatopsis anabasis TaxID=1840409 RepID=UPI001FE71469|nr:PQQ-dependent sugar dehydrogenase [Amycolatopsis anabasis]